MNKINDWTTVHCTITGPENATEDMLINNGREAIGRAHQHQVGYCHLTSEVRLVSKTIGQFTELDCDIEIKGQPMIFIWDRYTVTPDGF